MLVFGYFLFDFYFLLLNALLTLLFSSMTAFVFKDQFLFLCCMPYLLETKSITFIVTSFSGVLYLYPYLLLLIFGFLVPIVSFIGFLFLLLPILTWPTVTQYARFCFFVLAFLVVYIYAFVFSVLSFVVWSLLLFVPNFYYVVDLSFDFTLDSWIRTALYIVSFFLFFFLFCLLLLFVLSTTEQSGIFCFRLLSVFSFLVFLSIFVPYDLFLHVVLFLFFFLTIEVLIILKFFWKSYCGRVA
jgi:hypothetical protein